jgi:hypothetical protein
MMLPDGNHENLIAREERSQREGVREPALADASPSLTSAQQYVYSIWI